MTSHRDILAILLAGFTLVAAAPAGAASCVPPPSGLLSWYRAEGNAVDAVGTNDGVLNNGVLFAKGQVGRAFNFNQGPFVSAPSIPQLIFGTQSFTVDLWVNFTAITSRAPFVAHDDGASNTKKWIFWYDEQGHDTPSGPALRFHINGPDIGPKDPIFVPWNPVPGTWYHVAVTRAVVGENKSKYALYIDGVQVATSNSDHGPRDAEAPLTLGGAEFLFFNGRLDEVDIFDRALSSNEIQAIFAAGTLGKCVPPSRAVVATVTGILPRNGKVTCTNVTTAQSVVVEAPKNVRFWDCEDGGLVVNTGDEVRVQLNVIGKAD